MLWFNDRDNTTLRFETRFDNNTANTSHCSIILTADKKCSGSASWMRFDNGSWRWNRRSPPNNGH